jgi:transposase
MARTTAGLALTTTQQQRLRQWAPAATTPQRLARRARVILGTAAGLGTRRLAQQERMSRTTVQRWRARFLIAGCDGLQDRPRRGRPTLLPPTSRALVVALACERPANRGVPLSRYSLSDLTAEVAAELGDAAAASRSSVWRWLTQDALRLWRHDCWIFPRDPRFLERAGPVLDLYACRWQGQPLWADEYVLSAVRRRASRPADDFNQHCHQDRSNRHASNTSLNGKALSSTWRRGMCIGRWCSGAVSRRPAKLPLVDWSTRSWTKSRTVRRAACSGSSTTARHIAASAPPKHSGHVTRVSSSCTLPCTRVGSIRSKSGERKTCLSHGPDR